MRTLRAGAFIALALTALAMPEVALAHFKGAQDWYIGPHTYNNEGRRTDPLNLFFYPYADSQAELEAHLVDHWRDRWTTDGNTGCKDDQSVGFKADGGGFPRVPTDFHGAGLGSFTPSCANRYHLRAWGDYFHEQVSNMTHTLRQGNEPWIIANMHYERARISPTDVGHDIARDWDLVEWFVVSHRSKLRAHSSNYKWRVLPGSKQKYGGKHNDGYITRVSPKRHG